GGLPTRINEIMRIAEEARPHFIPHASPGIRRSLGEGGPHTSPQQALGRPLVLSDAAHSFGATIAGKKVGSQADITGFSFHAVKNPTTAEGGALAFNLPEGFDHEAIYGLFNTMSLHGQSKDALAK